MAAEAWSKENLRLLLFVSFNFYLVRFWLMDSFQAGAVSGEGAFDEAAFVESSGDAAVDNVLHFKIAYFGGACFQKSLHIAQPFYGWDRLAIDAAGQVQITIFRASSVCS